MPEQNQLPMKSGDIILDHCSACGKSWVEHLGIQSLCAETAAIKEKVSELETENERLRIEAVDR